MTHLQEQTALLVPHPDGPYVGLRDFTEEYADLFFGRTVEQKRIIGNLRAARLTLLYAESGVGKSSLLRAGVVPRLRQLAERARATGVGARYVPVVFSSWGAKPVDALISAISEAIGTLVEPLPELPRGELEEAIAVAVSAIDATLLIILDQFEEFFLYSRSPDETFAGQLAQCINRADLRANFLISIREDSYARVGDLLNGRLANVYGNYLHLEYLDRQAARDAIVKPIDRFNDLRADAAQLAVAPELVNAVLDQVRRGQIGHSDGEQGPDGRAGADETTRVETTYLQLVMKRLWDEEAAAGSRTLRLETLDRLGGAETIIGTHLDTSMSELSAAQQETAATAFRFLVTPGGTKIALTLEDLTELCGLREAQLDPMLRRLTAPDLHILRSVASDSPDHASFEIFHDALARPILAWRARYRRRQADRRNRRRNGLLVALSALCLAMFGIIAFLLINRNGTDETKRLHSTREIRTNAVEEFSFRGDAGRLATLSTVFERGVHADVEVKDPGGKAIVQRSDLGSDIANMNFALATTGDYDVRLSGADARSRFSVDVTESEDQYVVLNGAGPHRRSLNRQLRPDKFLFSGRAGAVVIAAVIPRGGRDADPSAQLEIRDPQGSPLAELNRRSVVIAALPVDGSYALRISGADRPPAKYDLTLAIDEPKELGDSQSGGLDRTAPARVYSVEAPVQGAMRFRLKPSATLDGAVALINAEGRVVDQVDHGPLGNEEVVDAPPGPGTYRVVVTVGGSSGKGEYVLEREIASDSSGNHLGAPDIPADARALVDELAAAQSGHDWNTVRALDPRMANASDADFEKGYGSLQRNTFIPVRWEDAGGGVVTLRGGLVADEGPVGTRLFCVTFDANLAQRKVEQRPGGRIIDPDHRQGVTPESLEDETLATCG